MNSKHERDLNQTLRMLAKKGTYDVFLCIKDRDIMHYNDVLKYTLDNNLIKSRASVTTILNDLTDHGFLDRKVVQTRPTRTQYRISKTGLAMLKHLEEIEKVIKKS